MKPTIIDIQHLSDVHVATLDNDGELTLHTRLGESAAIHSREALLLACLLDRNEALLEEKSAGRTIAEGIHLWAGENVYHTFILARNIKHGSQESYSWIKMMAHPGTLYLLPSTPNWVESYGGLTEDKKAILFLPASTVAMYERQYLVQNALVRFGWTQARNSYTELRSAAAQVEDPMWNTDLRNKAAEESRRVSYWREIAGDEPLINDSNDIRHRHR